MGNGVQHGPGPWGGDGDGDGVPDGVKLLPELGMGLQDGVLMA